MKQVHTHAREGNRFVLSALDGYPLGATLFEPQSTPLGDVLVLPATAVPQSYYARFAAHLARRGFRALTFDYRGVGASREGTLRGFEADLRMWAELDAGAAHRWLRSQTKQRPLYLVGHSLGGQLLGLDDTLHDNDGTILVGAQLGYYGHWPRAQQPQLALTWNAMIPALTRTFGYLPGWAGLSEDLPRGAALQWAEWCRSPNYLLDHVEGARDTFARHHAPTLFYSFTDDEFAPPPAVEAFLSVLGPKELVHRRVHPKHIGSKHIGHFGFFRSRFEKTLWSSAVGFLHALHSGNEVRSGSEIPYVNEFQLTQEDLLADLAYGR